MLRKYHFEFQKSVSNRIDFCHKNDLEIVSALSGGFDSRAVFRELTKNNVNATHITYEYIQDESGIAKQLYEYSGAKGKYLKLSFDNKFNLIQSYKYLLECDGMINLFTASVCEKDAACLKQNTNNKSAF